MDIRSMSKKDLNDKYKSLLQEANSINKDTPNSVITELIREIDTIVKELNNRLSLEPRHDKDIVMDITNNANRSQIFNLSTGHLTLKTRQLFKEQHLIHINLDHLYYDLVIYDKDDYGWFVYICENHDTEHTGLNVNRDIDDCVQTALDLNCSMICFDRDADTYHKLAVYND